MAKRKYIPLYHSYLDAIEPLGDAERGRLFTACLIYSKTGAAPELSGNERFVFPMMRAQIDRDDEAYEETCNKNSENARKRWEDDDASASDGMRVDANDAKEKEKEKENTYTVDSDADAPKPTKRELDNFFESIWALYPEKKGKGQVSEAKKRALFRIGFDEMSRCIGRYKAGKPEWQKYQNGSTFFNSGYVDYLDANYAPGELQSEPARSFVKTGTDEDGLDVGYWKVNTC